MSFMPNTGTVVQLVDERVGAVTRFARSGDDLVFPDSREERNLSASGKA